jgi:hypothetical protein
LLGKVPYALSHTPSTFLLLPMLPTSWNYSCELQRLAIILFLKVCIFFTGQKNYFQILSLGK